MARTSVFAAITADDRLIDDLAAGRTPRPGDVLSRLLAAWRADLIATPDQLPALDAAVASLTGTTAERLWDPRDQADPAT